MLRQTPALEPVRAIVRDYCEARARCEALFAWCDAHPEDMTAADRYQTACLERRHTLRLLMPYMPHPPDAGSWEGEGDILA